MLLAPRRHGSAWLMPGLVVVALMQLSASHADDDVAAVPRLVAHHMLLRREAALSRFQVELLTETKSSVAIFIGPDIGSLPGRQVATQRIVVDGLRTRLATTEWTTHGTTTSIRTVVMVTDGSTRHSITVGPGQFNSVIAPRSTYFEQEHWPLIYAATAYDHRTALSDLLGEARDGLMPVRLGEFAAVIASGTDHAGATWRIWLSLDHDFTPLRVEEVTSNGWRFVMDYGELQPIGEKLWAPGLATRRTYTVVGGTAELPNRKEILFSRTNVWLRNYQLLESVPDALFELQLPPGMPLIDTRLPEEKPQIVGFSLPAQGEGAGLPAFELADRDATAGEWP